MTSFNKKALSAEEQIELLVSRRLIIEDKKSAIEVIKRIGYYRLSSYMRNFQDGENHIFRDNITFQDILNLYNFDENLRQICFIATQKIEIAYRAAISNVMCKKYDSHWFSYLEAFRDKNDFNNCQELIKSEIKKNSNQYADTFIAKYYEKYDEPELPPFWMVAETLTIGSLNKLYQMLNISNKRAIIAYLNFGFDKKFMVTANWFFVICTIRNICAHHSRLFNRIFRITPTKQALVKELNVNCRNSFYYIAMVINYYLKTISNDVSFENDLIKLFEKYPNIDKAKMGFPKEWMGFSITTINRKNIIMK